ncbi:restriction endonuclease subunit S [Chryseobacterium indologenes]|uniref:restriction endonuclease subunit S n=1 Tax=Chryseobacterium indologenes TaxID=253 RepID=UPI0009A19248|nr:restriction endonuclease subunit S [Chryseobacterium indologenes]
MASRGDIKIEEVQPELMKNWLKLNFNETIDKSGRFVKLKSKDYFEKGNFPVIDQGDKFISGYVNNENLLYQGELPVIIFGDHTRNVKFINFTFAAGADGTKILKPKSFYNPSFYYYYFKSLRIPDLGYSRHSSILKDIKFPLPPLTEQNNIVEKLDSLFGQLENIKGKIHNLKITSNKFTQSCLKNPKQKECYKYQKIGQYLEECTERIGENWKGIRLVGVSAKEGIIDLRIGQKDSFEKYKIVKTGDLIYNTMRVNIGSIAIYEGIENALTSPDYVVFRVKRHVSPQLLLNYLKSEQGLLEIGTNTKGSVRARLYFSALSEIKMPIAPVQIQSLAEKFLKEFSNSLKKIHRIEKVTLESLSRAILVKAFKGELTEQLDTDEDTKEFSNDN